MAGTVRCDRIFRSERCRAMLVPRAVYRPGGPLGGNPNPGQNGQSSRLIIPGQTASPAAPSRPPSGLVIPGQDKIAKGDDSGGKPATNIYRPPAGFMNDAKDAAESGEKLTADEMLTKLKAGVGYWHELGKWFGPLLSEGIDSNVIEEMSGITRVDQNTMSVAANVFESLKTSDEFPDDKLEHFDYGGQYLLYELRSLTGKPRVAAAEYICDEELDQQQCLELARAVKEHIRRNGKREGFSTHPGDCLAFKFYRNAIETRETDQKASYIKKGLDAAVTEPAREKLEKLQADAGEVEEVITANLSVLRLSRDELGMRPVPVAGTLGEVTAEEIAACPTTSREGPFGVFNITSADHQWMGFPRWGLVESSDSPVAILLDNCADTPAVLEAKNAKSDEEIKQLQGPGMVVCERKVDDVSEEFYYCIKKENGVIDIVHGAQADGNVIGVALFVCRPADRESPIDELEF